VPRNPAGCRRSQEARGTARISEHTLGMDGCASAKPAMETPSTAVRLQRAVRLQGTASTCVRNDGRRFDGRAMRAAARKDRAPHPTRSQDARSW